jgi:AICAR transformylase/IMP cyclohydrolase PurH
MNNIDQLTLELLVNKGQYKKYLSIADPQRFEQQKKHLDKIAKYENKIRSMFSNLLEGKQITNDINESFDHFIKECIRYCENKELENDYPKDEDIMFGNIDSDEEMHENNNYPTDEDESPTTQSSSYWGQKIVKKPAMRNHLKVTGTLDMFLSTKQKTSK